MDHPLRTIHFIRTPGFGVGNIRCDFTSTRPPWRIDAHGCRWKRYRRAIVWSQSQDIRRRTAQVPGKGAGIIKLSKGGIADNATSSANAAIRKPSAFIHGNLEMVIKAGARRREKEMEMALKAEAGKKTGSRTLNGSRAATRKTRHPTGETAGRPPGGRRGEETDEWPSEKQHLGKQEEAKAK